MTNKTTQEVLEELLRTSDKFTETGDFVRAYAMLRKSIEALIEVLNQTNDKDSF